jgi:ribosome recycling factor
MAMSKIIAENRDRMEKALEFLRIELRAVRTGRASTGLVENIKVDYYGNPTALKQLAALAAPQADLIVIKPYDPASVKDIEKAIKNSDLSIAPMVDGKIIRLNVPPLSQERRKQLTNHVRQLGEQAKISIRNIRRDANKQLEQAEQDKLITEDDLEKDKKEVDNLAKDHIENIDSAVKTKSDEIMLH